MRGSACHHAHAGELLPEDYALAKPRKLDQMMAEAADRLYEATRSGGPPQQQLTVVPGAELANGHGSNYHPSALAEVAPPPPPADDALMEQAPPPPPPG